MGPRSVLVTAAHDESVRVWDPLDHRQVDSIPSIKESQVNCIALSTIGDQHLQMALGGYQWMRLYDMNHLTQPLHVFNVHERNVSTIGFNKEGTWMYTGGEENTAKVWDLRSSTVLCQRILQLHSSVNSIVLHPNQRELLVADSTGGIYIWDIRTNRDDSLMTELNYTEFIVDLDIDQDGKQVAAITNKGSCFLYNNLQESMLNDGISYDDTEFNAFGPAPSPTHIQADHRTTPVVKFKPHAVYGLKCKFSHDGKMLATSAGDDIPKIWDLDVSNKNSLPLREDVQDFDENGSINMKWIWGLAFSKNSKTLFTAGSDGVARSFDLNSIKHGSTAKFTGHMKGITAMALHDNGNIP